MENGMVEFYLASIWKYQEAGVSRVLDFLRCKHPSGQYSFEKDESWFKVACHARDVHSVQAIFREVHDEIERGMKAMVGNSGGPLTLPSFIDDYDPYSLGSYTKKKVEGSDSVGKEKERNIKRAKEKEEMKREKKEGRDMAKNEKENIDFVDIAGIADGSKDSGGNPWLKMPSPGELSTDIPDKAPVDQLCPVAFDQYNYSKVWTRVRAETPSTISVQTFLSENDRQSIMAGSGVHVELDITGRLVFLGGPTKDCLSKATKMLDNMFNKFTYVLPPPKHMLYAEIDGPYHVDARFMAHVNDGMLTSTIFDPGQYPGTDLDNIFKAVFAKAACLRICLYDHFKRMEVSYFGPKMQPIFSDQARMRPIWFRRTEYAPKVLGATAPKKTGTHATETTRPASQVSESLLKSEQAQGVELIHIPDVFDVKGKGKEVSNDHNSQALISLSKQVDLLDLLEDDIPFPEMKAVSSSVIATASVTPTSLLPSSPICAATSVARVASDPNIPSSLVAKDFAVDTYSYQMKLLQEFVYDPFKKIGSIRDELQPANTNGSKEAFSALTFTNGDHHHNARPSNTNDSGNGLATEEQPLITFLEADAPLIGVATPTDCAPSPGRNNMLIEIDAPPPPSPLPPPPPAPQQRQTASVNASTRERPNMARSSSKALVRRTTFANNLCNYIGRLMADLPYSRGRIRLQVEIGRIYLMDATPEGLAFNSPGEAASGWPHADITTRLDTVCVSPESIVFTKALTLFANDIESVLGISNGAKAAAVEGVSIDGILNDTSSCPSPPPSACPSFASSLEWTFHGKRTVYELKCQRRFVTSTGAVKVQSPFVVEIDGTDPDAFSYSLRRVEDNRPPIWIHCIRRHWDARVVVSYSQTDKLEASYGDFSRELLCSMVVPPGPMTNPKFQIAYDHQEKKKDGRTFFTKVLSARVRNVGRFVSADRDSYLDVSWNRHMTIETKADKNSKLTGTMRFAAADDDPSRGMFASWYEASVVSAAAEERFRENETLAAGGMASWGASSNAEQDNMYEAAFGPALRLVQKMDGVGVLIDNGHGDGRLWTPPTRARKVKAVQKFW